jgi:hypothetical protein
VQPPPSAQRSDLVLSPRYPKACKGSIQILEELIASEFRPEAAVSCRYYFFRDVFFATFLVAFAVFLAFFAFLAMWSSMTVTQ